MSGYEVRVLPADTEPVQANWEDALDVTFRWYTESSRLRIYQRPNGRHLLVQQYLSGDTVVWDSRHAQPEPLCIDGHALHRRYRNRRRRT